MLRALQQFGKRERQAIFFLLFGTGLALLLGAAAVLGLSFISPSSESVALVDSVTVREFAALPDDDAYPPAVAIAADGTLYTGSFVSGVLWSIDSAGNVLEIPNTRNGIGSVIGLAALPDGALLVIDQLDDNPATGGGSILRVTLDGAVSTFATSAGGRNFIAPDDLTLDSEGAVYMTDRGRGEVLRFEPDGGAGVVWWTPPRVSGEQSEPTGITYDPLTDSILVTDPTAQAVFRVAVSDGATETIYLHGERPTPPGFDGLTVTPDGEVYVAALEQNGVARLENGELHYIAGLFRGSSDVDYFDDKLFVPNFDQFSLVLTVANPRLPFALDVIDLAPEG